MLTFEFRIINGYSSQSRSFSLSYHDSCLEASNKASWFLSHNWVRDQKVVLETFFNTKFGTSLVFEGVETETERGIFI